MMSFFASNKIDLFFFSKNQDTHIHTQYFEFAAVKKFELVLYFLEPFLTNE